MLCLPDPRTFIVFIAERCTSATDAGPCFEVFVLDAFSRLVDAV